MSTLSLSSLAEALRMQKLIAGMALGVLTSAIVGCDTAFVADILPTKEIVPAVPATPTPYSALEQSIHQQINQYRQSQKLPPLTLDPRISEQARAHSRNMASGKVTFSHQGFEQRVEAIRRSIFYLAAAENVAFNYGYSNPAQQAVEGWIKSPGHLINIEGQYNLTGIGVDRNAKGEYYFTQIFIRRW